MLLLTVFYACLVESIDNMPTKYTTHLWQAYSLKALQLTQLTYLAELGAAQHFSSKHCRRHSTELHLIYTHGTCMQLGKKQGLQQITRDALNCNTDYEILCQNVLIPVPQDAA